MKTLLLITDRELPCWQRDRDGWSQQAPNAPSAYWAVTDLAQESLVQIDVPRLFGRDRAHYMARQLASHFPDTPFRSALATLRWWQRLSSSRRTLAGVDAAARIHAALSAQPGDLAGLWSMSQLLALAGRHQSLPRELFVLLPSRQGLRLVFLKDREPVLARFAPGALSTREQLAEVLRTLRHLENSHVLPHAPRRYGLLVLGPGSDWDELLADLRLDRVAPPPPWNTLPPPDWHLALFDLALRSPQGQLAPRPLRVAFMARRLNRATWGTGALVLGATLWALAGQLSQTREALRQRDQASLQGAPLAAQLAQADQELARLGVTPAFSRQAIALDTQEPDPSPDIAASVAWLADSVSRYPDERLNRLGWTVRGADEGDCVTQTPAPTNTTRRGSPPRVEISFELKSPSAGRADQRERTLAGFSQALRRLPGATLVQDPARAQPSLSNAPQDTAAASQGCLSFSGAGWPGVRP